MAQYVVVAYESRELHWDVTDVYGPFPTISDAAVHTILSADRGCGHDEHRIIELRNVEETHKV